MLTKSQSNNNEKSRYHYMSSLCHICKESQDEHILQGKDVLYARCKNTKCSRSFCETCILDYFGKIFSEGMMGEEWLCYVCDEKCECEECKNREMDKKDKKKSIFSSAFKLTPKTDSEKPSQLQDYYSQDYLNSATPFARRIFTQRNNLLKLMASQAENHQIENIFQSSKPIEKASNPENFVNSQNFKFMIQNQLKNYEDDDDLELLD